MFLIFLLVFSVVYSEEFSFNKNLYFGLKNDSDVTRLQQFLTDEEFYNGPVNGNFFSLTLAAVKKFQEARGIIPVLGYVGPKTREILNKELVAKALPKTPEDISKLINDLLAQVKKLEEQLAAAKVAEDAQKVAPVPAPAPAPAPSPVPAPAPAPKTDLDSSLKIVISYPSVTLNTYDNVTITEFKISDDVLGEKVAIKRIKFTNNGTLNSAFFTDLRLVNSKNGIVVTTTPAPTNGAIEFKFIEDAAKLDKGLMVSDNTYSIMTSFRTPNTTEKQKVRLDIMSAADIDAFDFNDLERKALVTKSNTFPIVGPTITLP